MPFTLTKEHLIHARTYMPIYDKIQTAKAIAELSLVDIDTDEQNKVGETLIALPHLKGEDLTKKHMVLCNTLLGYYFDIDMPEKNPDGSDVDPYERHDYYAGGHLLNQIERFKSDPEVKDIVFDLLADYKEFKKIVDTEIYNRKSNTNDLIPRFAAAVAVLASPESVKAIVEEVKALGEQRDEMLKDRKKALAKALAESQKAKIKEENEANNVGEG